MGESRRSLHSALRLCLGAQESGPLSEPEAAAVLRQCLSVVAACHERGVVHGDIKPANFLMVGKAERMR